MAFFGQLKSAVGDRRAARSLPIATSGSVGVRATLMLTTAIVGALALANASEVSAQANPCGAPDASGRVRCTPAGNPYAEGIDYSAPVQDLTVVLDEGVVVQRGPGANSGVRLRAPAGKATLQAAANTSVTTAGASQSGVVATASGDIALTAPNVTTSGANAFGVVALSNNGNVAITARSVRTTGNSSTGILGYAYGARAITIDATQAVSATGAGAGGIYANGQSGAITITSRDVVGNAGAIRAKATGAITVTANGNLTGQAGSGVIATTTNGPVAVTVNGSVNAVGAGVGVTSTVGDVAVTVTGPITTSAAIGAYGVSVQSSGATTIRTGSVTSTTTTFVGGGVFARSASANIALDGNVAVSGTAVTALRTIADVSTIAVSGNVVGTNRASGFLIQAAAGQKAKSTIRVGGAVATTDAGAVSITARADVDLAVAGGITATRGTGMSLPAER